jgi:hypothetical protein
MILSVTSEGRNQERSPKLHKFLIGARIQLEIDATQTKQTFEPISNRDKNTSSAYSRLTPLIQVPTAKPANTDTAKFDRAEAKCYNSLPCAGLQKGRTCTGIAATGLNIRQNPSSKALRRSHEGEMVCRIAARRNGIGAERNSWSMEKYG